MDQEKEIYSQKLVAGSRVYFFDVKATERGEKYLRISETQPKQGNKIAHRLMVFEDHFDEFFRVLEEVKKFL